MLREKFSRTNCCIVCRNLVKDKSDYEHLFVILENDSKSIIQVTDIGYLYEELIGIKFSLDSCAYYPKLLCPRCGLQMKLFKKLKDKALKTLESLNKEFHNVQEESLAAMEPVLTEADFLNDDLIEYEHLEFINDANINNEDDVAEGYNKILAHTRPASNAKSLEQNNLTTSTTIRDNLITKEDLSYITLELSEDIDENDYITEIYEILHNCDADQNNDDSSLNVPVAAAKKVSQEQEPINNLCNAYQRQQQKQSIKESPSSSLRKKDLKCELCHIEFECFKDMKAHVNNVHNGKYPCGQCLKLFKTIKSLRVHVNLHKGQLQYKCDLCSRAFNQKVHYQTHVRQHKNDRNFQCGACEKAFFTKADLKIHERKHTGQRPYICDICDKDFILAIHLKMHQYSHTKEKRFPCDYCKRSFVTPNTLRLHKQTIHLLERQFNCEYCAKSFRRKHHLMYHIRNIHGLRTLIAKEQKQPDDISNISDFILMPDDLQNVIDHNHIDNDLDTEQFIEFTNDALII